MRVLIIVAAIVLLYLMLRWQYNKNPQNFTKKFLYWLAILLGMVLLLFAVTGRLHWLYALLVGLVPAVGRLLSLIRFLPVLKIIQSTIGSFKNQGQASAGQNSSVESRYFRMELDHDSGEMTGMILEGPFRGRQLSDLDMQQLISLYHECLKHDPDSESLLAVFMDRKYGAQWRENMGANQTEQPHAAPVTEEMTRKQALDILGVTDPVEEKEIVQAHRRLMQKFHPDRGGSNYLAAKINAAKDFLLHK